MRRSATVAILVLTTVLVASSTPLQQTPLTDEQLLQSRLEHLLAACQATSEWQNRQMEKLQKRVKELEAQRTEDK